MAAAKRRERTVQIKKTSARRPGGRKVVEIIEENYVTT